MKTNIVLVEDDEKVSRLLSRFLHQNDYNVVCITEGKPAVSLILNSQPEVVLLDLKLPDIDGISVCEQLRPEYKNGILMLTASESEIHEVMALNAGIDDFMSKPARPHVLLARLNRIVARQKSGAEAGMLAVQDLVLDVSNRTLLQNNQEVDVSESEFDMLCVFARNIGKTLSREALFNQLMEAPYNGFDRAIDMRVSKLRQKLAIAQPDRKYISTIRHRGYQLLG